MLKYLMISVSSFPTITHTQEKITHSDAFLQTDETSVNGILTE
jgi:hypothetical protein